MRTCRGADTKVHLRASGRHELSLLECDTGCSDCEGPLCGQHLLRHRRNDRFAQDSPIRDEFVWTIRGVGIDHVLLGSDFRNSLLQRHSLRSRDSISRQRKRRKFGTKMRKLCSAEGPDDNKAIPGTEQKCEVCNLHVLNPQSPPFIHALVPPSAAPPPPAVPEPSSPPAPQSPIELRLQPCWMDPPPAIRKAAT